MDRGGSDHRGHLRTVCHLHPYRQAELAVEARTFGLDWTGGDMACLWHSHSLPIPAFVPVMGERDHILHDLDGTVVGGGEN